MKIKIFLSILTLGIIIRTFSQNTLELTFTTIDSTSYTQIDSIIVKNRTQGGDTVLYWPDTVLRIDYQMGIYGNKGDIGNFKVFQNYPNPVKNHTTISIYVPEKGKVGLIITDLLGRTILKSDRILDKGIHFFRFTPDGGNLYFFTAKGSINTSTIKILIASSNLNLTSSLEHIGYEVSIPHLKAVKDIRSFNFSMGDTLLYIGFKDSIQSGILHAPKESQTYTLQFATNIPCPEMPAIEYEGQVYNTVQIFSQCWLKENLNVGTMILGNRDMKDSIIIEKYCYNNEQDSCTKYGGLYQWDEIMQYTTTKSTQGICPTGWHIPNDEEWKILEGALDSQYPIGNNEWDNENWRGYDAVSYLKSTSGWKNGNNGTNSSGFTALPAGYRSSVELFRGLHSHGNWWSSTEYNLNFARGRSLFHESNKINRSINGKSYGFGVRCLRD